MLDFTAPHLLHPSSPFPTPNTCGCQKAVLSPVGAAAGLLCQGYGVKSYLDGLDLVTVQSKAPQSILVLETQNLLSVAEFLNLPSLDWHMNWQWLVRQSPHAKSLVPHLTI